MKRTVVRIVALCIVLTLMLSGCGVIDLKGFFQRLAGIVGPMNFSSMQYVRPDLSMLDSALESCVDSAAAGDDLDGLVEKIMVVNGICNDFLTNYQLAFIHYSMNVKDIYWGAEYDYCLEHSTQVQAAVDQMLYALADSSLREQLEDEQYFGPGYFDDYDGESLWDEEFTALMEQETALINEYHDISEQALAVEPYSEEYYSVYGVQMEQVYVELIALRQRIAQQAGFGSYPEFAYDFYYDRDYTPQQAQTLMENIQAELVPLYREQDWSTLYLNQWLTVCTEAQTFAYVKDLAKAMGGQIQDAFQLMDTCGLYHISYGENKYDASFEVFLPNYMVPFVFVNPTQTSNDKLTFTHEFGHFCNDYASGGTAVGIDVAEIFSQGLEYLSLCYGGDEDLQTMKMADSLCVYVEQAAYASFEAQVYSLSGDGLNTEAVRQLFGQMLTEFGMDQLLEPWSYVAVGHFFTSPQYIISYVVSNDAALQLYQMEKAQAGSGLACYEQNLATEQADFLAFLDSAGLESPFEYGHIGKVRQTIEDALG